MNEYIYESEFDELIKHIFNNTYKLKDSLLEEYLLERFLLLRKKENMKKIDLPEFCDFLAEELFIDSKSDSFFYKDTLFRISSPYNQSIYNVVINWSFFSKICGIFSLSNNELSKLTKIESHVKELIKKGKNKTNKINKKYKEYVYKDYVLSQLNMNYGIVPEMPHIPNDIKPIKDCYFSGRNLENICKSNVQAMMFDSNSNELTLEKDIESFLFSNLSKVFPDKKVVSRQKNIGNGCILDMVLEDDNYEYIVELKNKKDDRLYWQIVKYYSYYKPNKKPVKMIALAPEYSNEMLESLKNIEYLDIFLFSIKIQNEKITDMFVQKVS